MRVVPPPMKKEPQKFTGADRRQVVIVYLTKLLADIEDFKTVQTRMNYIFMFSLVLSVSTLLTMIILK